MMKHNDFLRAAAALTVTLGLAAAPHAVSAQEASPFDARQSEAIERLVQQYLLEHPEVLVEALRRYAQQQQAAEARRQAERSEEHTSELQSLMRISYAVF